MNEKLLLQLIHYSKYFNMKEVCELAEVNYGSYRNFKSNQQRYPLSDENIEKLLQAMKAISKQIK